MKKFISLFVGCMVSVSAIAAPSGRGRVSMSGQMSSSPRVTMSKGQISAIGAMNSKSTTGNSAVANNVDVSEEQTEPAIDMREKERTACMSNNVGVGNTFVWASKYSNLNDYASMIEDVTEPANNTCFVKVELKTQDERIDISDIQGKYFEMGKSIVCASWADEEVLRKRILDGKKKARAWGTVGAVVGGAGIGVAAMELFGNKAIGGKVEGQKDLETAERMRSQLLVLQQKDPEKYNKVIEEVKVQLVILKENCANVTDKDSIKICNTYSPLIVEYIK